MAHPINQARGSNIQANHHQAQGTDASGSKNKNIRHLDSSIAPALPEAALASSWDCFSSLGEALWNFIRSIFSCFFTKAPAVEPIVEPAPMPQPTPYQLVKQFHEKWSKSDAMDGSHEACCEAWRRELSTLPTNAFMAAFNEFRKGEYKGPRPTDSQEFEFMKTSVANGAILKGLRQWLTSQEGSPARAERTERKRAPFDTRILLT